MDDPVPDIESVDDCELLEACVMLRVPVGVPLTACVFVRLRVMLVLALCVLEELSDWLGVRESDGAALCNIAKDTATGKFSYNAMPLPSSPLWLSPQQYATPAAVKPHV